MIFNLIFRIGLDNITLQACYMPPHLFFHFIGDFIRVIDKIDHIALSWKFIELSLQWRNN